MKISQSNLKTLSIITIMSLVSIVLISCSSNNTSREVNIQGEKIEIDKATPEQIIITLIDAINLDNAEYIDYLVDRNLIVDLLPTNSDTSNMQLSISEFEILYSDSLEVSLRVKLRQTDSSKKVNSIDKLFTMQRINQGWDIINVERFIFKKQTEISMFDALALIYGEPQNGEYWNYDSVSIEPNFNFLSDYTYYLISTTYKSNENPEDGFSNYVEATINAASLRWNGLRWEMINKADSIITYFTWKYSNINFEVAYLLKDNLPFFLITESVVGESELIDNYTYLNLNLKVFHQFQHARESIPGYAGGDGSIVEKPISLSESYKFYTFDDDFYNAVENNKEFRIRFGFDENDKPVYMQIWHKDQDRKYSEGKVALDPNNKNEFLPHGLWDDPIMGWKGYYDNGRKVDHSTDVLNVVNEKTNIEKCTWCKMGVIVNGYCDMCGVASQTTRHELNESINNRNLNTNIVNCPNRTMHPSLRYPETCPSCGYVGLIK